MAVSTRKNYKIYCEAFKQLLELIEQGLVTVRPAKEDINLHVLQAQLQDKHFTLIAKVLETKAQGEEQGKHHDEL